jgi:hypothetical protein
MNSIYANGLIFSPETSTLVSCGGNQVKNLLSLVLRSREY